MADAACVLLGAGVLVWFGVAHSCRQGSCPARSGLGLLCRGLAREFLLMGVGWCGSRGLMVSAG